MTTADHAKKFATLLKRAKSEVEAAEEPSFPAGMEDSGRLIRQLIFSMLMWEATRAQAMAAMRRIGEQLVDLNELRVCFAPEIATILGERYPRGLERAERLHAMLTEIYKREHGLNIDRLETLSKRDAKTYLETLEGMCEYTCARVILVGLGGHAMPCDERLRDHLAAEGALPEGLTPAEACGWLERQVRAGEALGAHHALQAWSDAQGTPAKREKKPEAPATRRTKSSAEGKPARKAPATRKARS